jgi:hypothetical protein
MLLRNCKLRIGTGEGQRAVRTCYYSVGRVGRLDRHSALKLLGLACSFALQKKFGVLESMPSLPIPSPATERLRGVERTWLA